MDDSKPPEDHDLVLLHGKTDAGVRAIRSRPGRLELTELRPLESGKPIGEREVVSLHKRSDSPLLWDVKVEVPGGSAGGATDRAGPPMVASESYRRNWEQIFGGEDPDDSNLN